MDIFSHFSNLIAAAGLFASSLIGGHPHAIANSEIKPTVTINKDSSASIYTAVGNVSYQGHQVAATINIPKEGGNISGKITGDCDGTITGTYDGKDNGVISGQGNSNCTLLFVQIPVTGTFTGTVNKEKSKANLTVKAKAASFDGTKEISLPLH
jgi:hypothetical protein